MWHRVLQEHALVEVMPLELMDTLIVAKVPNFCRSYCRGSYTWELALKCIAMLKGVPICIGIGMYASFCFPVLASGLDENFRIKLSNFSWSPLPRSCAPCGSLALVDGACTSRSNNGLGKAPQTFLISYASGAQLPGAGVKCVQF